MPGSYPAPETLADNALETLRHAYQERQSAEVGSLILKAHDLIARLKEEISNAGASKEDPYEINEHNSAIFCAAD